MNIVYLLTNLSNNKKYIGQKSECKIEKIDGIDTIINLKSELPYYGSSKNEEMKKDLCLHKFSASIIEIVNNRKELLKREDYYIRLYNAVESDEYYNLGYPSDFGKYRKEENKKIEKRDFQNSIKNIFGETYKEYASRESSISKRVNSARKIGFENLEDFYLDVYYKINKQEVLNYAALAREYNVERHTISRLVQEVNLNKFYNEVQNKNSKMEAKIKDLRLKGASIKKISEILNIEFATVLFYIGTKKIKAKNFVVAERKGLTEDELGYKIMEKFLAGEGFKKITSDLEITKLQATRYFHRFIRKHLEINDFKGIIKEVTNN